MAVKNNFPNMERFESLLIEAVKRVKIKEDPLILNEYKKIFKKHVPFSLRSYVGAYFAKLASEGNLLKGEIFEKKGSYRERFKQIPRTTIESSAAVKIFISAGRSRGVFPRDLISLISQEALIGKERIGEIRVLDNYSFVQVYAEDADGIISSLNGTEFRGRKLVVSYSRKKDDEENEAANTDKLSEKQNTAV